MFGTGQVTSGVDDGIITMTKGEIALFTLPAEKGYGVDGRDDVVPPNSVVRFEIELISWISVVDVSKDGGIIKKVMEKGQRNGGPGYLDEVLGALIFCYLFIYFQFHRFRIELNLEPLKLYLLL